MNRPDADAMTSAFDGSWSTTDANAAFASRASDFAIAAAARISSAVSGSSGCADASAGPRPMPRASASRVRCCRNMGAPG